MYKGEYRHEAQLPASSETQIYQVGITVFMLLYISLILKFCLCLSEM
jgi:hypothetical protein